MSVSLVRKEALVHSPSTSSIFKLLAGREEVRIVGWKNSHLRHSAVSDSGSHIAGLTYKDEEIIRWEEPYLVKIKAPYTWDQVLISRVWMLFTLMPHPLSNGVVGLSLYDRRYGTGRLYMYAPPGSWFVFNTLLRIFYPLQLVYSPGAHRTAVPTLLHLDHVSQRKRRDALIGSESLRRREERKVALSGFSASSAGVVWERGGTKWIALQTPLAHGDVGIILRPYLGHWPYGQDSYVIGNWDSSEKLIPNGGGPVERMARLSEPWCIYPKIDYWMGGQNGQERES